MSTPEPGPPSCRANRCVAIGVVAIALCLAVGALLLPKFVDETPSLNIPGITVPDSSTSSAGSSPSLVRWRQVAAYETGLSRPRGIAVRRDGTVYVVGDRQLRVFGPDGRLKHSFDLPDEPRAVAIDPEGVYVGYAARIAVLAADGSQRRSWMLPDASALVTSLAANGSGIWVGDAGTRIVLRYDKTGQLRRRIGARDDARGIPGFLVPSPFLDVAWRGGADVVVADPGRHRVETYGPQGELSLVGKRGADITGFCGCCNPTDIAVFPDGKVVTAEKGFPRVKVYTPRGELESVVVDTPGLSPGAEGIDVGVNGAGQVLALDPPARVVRIFVRK